MISRLYKKTLLFDAFPKVDSGYQQKTTQGGLATLIVSICLWFLILSECREYLHVSQSFEFLVDQSINRELQINVDITVNTQFLTVDLLDVAGERVHVANELQRAPTKFEVRTARHVGEAIDTPLNVHQM
ncbi:7511_t:CDS:2, partial [Ambispora gerdemannii]